MTSRDRSCRMFLCRVLPLLLLAVVAGAATAQADPPARVGSLSRIEGSVVMAPAGETEWTEATLNHPMTSGDRIWTDQGARAELHLGTAVLHIDSHAFLDLVALDEAQFQATLKEGSVNVRVRELQAAENLEIDTPQLAFRAAQPGDYRIDVDPAGGTTRVAVRSGMALVYGAGGQALQLQAGQQLAFAGRELEPVASVGPLGEDSFDRWAADRNRMEDQSVSARHVPRDVVGYAQLDLYGTWAQDPGLGPVWYPRVTAADWAPYRYGRWESISPWGWTWIDDAPWGFAPFHYGRWALIGSRWAWVPGRLGPRPVYAPALVAFIGGVGSGDGIGWYPLAPGEVWRPSYHASPAHWRSLNRFIGGSGGAVHVHRRRPEAATAVGIDDFRQGRPVHGRWSRLQPADLANAPVIAPPAMSGPRRWSDAGGRGNRRDPPTPFMAGPAAPRFEGPGAGRADRNERIQPQPLRPSTPRQDGDPREQPFQRERGPREQQLLQDRLQREQQAQRELREQQLLQLRAQRERQADQARDQQAQRREREQQLRNDQVLRQQQAAQEQFQRRPAWQQRAAPQPRREGPPPGFSPPGQRAPELGRPLGHGARILEGRGEQPSGDEGGRGRGGGHMRRFN